MPPKKETSVDNQQKETIEINSEKAVQKRLENPNEHLKAEISKQLHTMLEYALIKGIEIPENIAKEVESSEMNDLMIAHGKMIKSISPATPQSILVLNTIIGANGLKNYKKISNMPHIRNLLIFTFFILITLIGIGLSPEVNEESIKSGILNSSGYSLLLNLTFISLSATLGVLFFLLKTLTVKIKNCTYTEENIIETKALILIGTIAGFIIAEMVAVNLETIPNFDSIHKITLAMLGGFSSDAIFSILRGLVNKIKSILTGTTIKNTEQEI